MPRYIDADKLIALATHEGAYGYVDVHDIEKAARDGAIDIVQCEKCQFYSSIKTSSGHLSFCRKNKLIDELSFYDFCSRGERRNSNG